MNRGIVPVIYYILTGLTTLAAVICFFGWSRQLTMLYGTHTVSTGIVIVSGLLCMALGSYMAGKIADKTIRPLTVFIAFSVVTGLFFLFHNLIFKGIASVYLRTNHNDDPGPLGEGILTFISSLAMLLIPAGLTAGSFPLLIRHFIKHVSHSGRFMNAAILSLSLAMAFGLSLIVFLLIPKFGLHTEINCGAVVFLILASVTMVYLPRSPKKASKDSIIQRKERAARVSSIRFRKKQHVLETGAKLTRAILRVFSFQGFAVASMLLLSFRILVYYNTLRPSLFYGLTLILFFSGIATGSAIYNKLAEKPANKYMTLATLQVIMGFGALLSYVALNMLSEKFFQRLTDSPTFGHIVLIQSVLYLSFWLIPSLLTGLSLPLTGRLFPRRLQNTGSTFGFLGSVFCLSFASGCVVTATVLIPLMGLQLAYSFLAILTTISGLYLIFRDSRLIRGFRVGYAFSVLILLAITFSVFRFLLPKGTEHLSDKKIEGITATVIASEGPRHTRKVYINGQYAFGTDENSLKIQQFAAIIPTLLNRHIQTALVTGFGTGLTALKLEKYGVRSIHITDVFPEIIKLSSEVFADDNDDILTSSHVDISTEDPGSYLKRSVDQLDLITAGHDLLFKVPGIHNLEFYRLCYNKLSEQGILCQVLSLTGIQETEFASILKSCTNVFANTSLWYITSDHVLLVASKKDLSLEFCQLSSAFSVMNANSSLTSIQLPDIETVLAHIIMMEKQPGKRFAGAPENSDNHPFVEFNPGILTGTNVILPWLLKTPVDYDKIIDFREGCPSESNTNVIKKIRFLNQSLFQHVSFYSSKPKWSVVDFFELTGAPFQQYL